mmetsp:Transcript_22750/g.63267  ORF Transcript_22750/g.63267 Transcript_22750/m.63267 type:complete len:132 (-) Transcript_22750:871-1266(-)
MIRLLVCLTAMMVSTQAFVSPYNKNAAQKSLVVVHGEGTGGWGIGNSREISPEEFAKGERRAFEGYQLSDRGDFMRQVEKDAQSMKEDELAELMGVAGIAGISVKDPSTRLNKFGKELMDEDIEDDLDLSV